MKRVVRLLLPLLFLSLMACGDETAPQETGLSEARLRVLLEEAAAWDADLFRKLAELGAKIAPDPNLDLPFTPVILMTPFGDAASSHVSAVGDPSSVTPSRLFRAVDGNRPSTKPAKISVLAGQSITSIDFATDDEKVTGTVRFELKGLIKGHAEFSAERVDGDWRVVEFRLPHAGLTTRLQADGTWQVKELG